MNINVFLTAFQWGQVRMVEIPDAECAGDTNDVLQRIYHWGQNENQAVHDRCSVSAGDVIELQGSLYLILMAGFCKISRDQLNEFKKLNPTDKMKYLMGMENNNEKA